MPSSSPTPPGSSQVPSILSSIGNCVLKARKTANDPLEPYLHAARWFPMSIHPFASLKRVLLAGISLDDMDEDDLDMEESFSEEEKSLHMMFLRSVPALKKTLTEFANHPDQLPQFIAVLNDAANKARQADTHNIKKAIPNYLLQNLSGKPDPSLANCKDKASRGFHHPQFARSLIPISRVNEYDADPVAFIAGIEDGRINLTLKDGFPTFLYEDAADYDVDEKDKGLLQSRTLLCVYRHIFTSESSVQDGQRGATKPSKAAIHGLTSATPRTLAYAVVQAMIALSSQSAWDVQDKYGYSYEDLFDATLALFELDTGSNPWAEATLEWFNSQLPGLKSKSKKRKRLLQRGGNVVDEIVKQRRVKARREQQQQQDHLRHEAHNTDLWRRRSFSLPPPQGHRHHQRSSTPRHHEVDEDQEHPSHNYRHCGRSRTSRRWRVGSDEEDEQPPQDHSRRRQTRMLGGHSPPPQDHEADEDNERRKHNLHSQSRIINGRSPTLDEFDEPQEWRQRRQTRTPCGHSPTPQDGQEVDEDDEFSMRDHPPRYRNRVPNSQSHYRSRSLCTAAPQQ